ncbi:LysR substrate-binding domain-containing protein [Pseudomonas sp. NPDC089547]|uniref:LysR substrate-binding domain-containing protein n=1 Tax=Pseudomonas sp. NPDC089547 TaxID=3390652 RepID=UPI003D02B1DF
MIEESSRGNFLFMRNMDLEDLHIFRAVVQHGGIAHAARQLNRVPSNVTTRIKQLEERLSVALFRRQGRHLVLTDNGHTLLRHAQRLLQMADLAEQELQTGIAAGVLRLGSLESTAGARLPPYLSAYHQHFPEVSIELQTGITDVLLQKLAQYELDAAFVAEPFELGRFSSVPVFDDVLTLITAKGEATISQAADLQGRTVVVFPHGCSYRRRLVEWLAEEGVSPGKLLEFGSYHAIVACVAAGMGVGVISQAVLDHAVLGASVQCHPLPAALASNRTHLVWQGEMTAPVAAFMHLLQSPEAAVECMRPRAGSEAQPALVK